MNEQVPFVPAPGPSASETKQLQSPNSLIAQDAQDKARYRAVKAKALEDPQVRQLQDKADSATSEEEQRTASKEYYHALFDKMRELEPSLKDRIDRTEAATVRRLERGKAGQ